MATVIPKTSTVLTSLLRADFTTQWRNRKAVILTIIVPVIILISWKGLVDKVGGPFVLANSITIGLFASGIMGYSNSVARDRDKGIFQRLRVAPLPSWAIMASRLLVQLAMIVLITTAVFIIGKEYDGIALTPTGYVFTYLTAIVGGAVSLSVGQMVVGFIKNPETVNSTTRLVYLAFILGGMFGELDHALNQKQSQISAMIDKVVLLSPYGTVKTMLSAVMEPTRWDSDTSIALFVTILYIIGFTTLGIKWFKWNTK
ncbi:MAG TPA: ABC transporter permease [Mucilaginibacter sp.]|nr:ABC transporter permease [Mucilaginibacter sp.]